MTSLGYALSTEEHKPGDLVEYAGRAEDAGFEFALISDHFHPWIERQGNAAFVWSVLGGIAERTDDLEIGTGVTCPLIRIHPAIVAQAAATTAAMFDGRFFLGVGTGENLNEHVLGDRWPPHGERLEMLDEAVDVIRELWEGEMVTRRGDHYTVENAKLYTLPDETPPIHVAASGEETASAAGRIGDGLVSTAPQEDLVDAFADAGDGGPGGEGAGDRPRYGQVTACWADSEDEAVSTAREWWPNTVVPGLLTSDLPTPLHFEQATEDVSEDEVAESVVCGPDPERHVEKIEEFAEAGFDHVYVHQIGPDQEGFFEFYEDEVLPAFD